MRTRGRRQAFALPEGPLTTPSSSPASVPRVFCAFGRSPSHTHKSNRNQHLSAWRHPWVSSPEVFIPALTSSSPDIIILSCGPRLGTRNTPVPWGAPLYLRGVMLASAYIMLL